MIEVVTREIALERGVGRYFTGSPCANGHLSERRTNSRHCIACVQAAKSALAERRGPDGVKAAQRDYDAKFKAKDPARKHACSRAAMERLKGRDPDYYRRKALEWNASNPERLRDTRARYREMMRSQFPEMVKVRTAAANAKIRVLARGDRDCGRLSDLTKSVKAVWDRCGGRCERCGSTDRLELDHILAVSKGGDNRFDNLQFLCFPCNRSKRARDHAEWLTTTAIEEIAA